MSIIKKSIIKKIIEGAPAIKVLKEDQDVDPDDIHQIPWQEAKRRHLAGETVYWDNGHSWDVVAEWPADDADAQGDTFGVLEAGGGTVVTVDWSHVEFHMSDADDEDEDEELSMSGYALVEYDGQTVKCPIPAMNEYDFLGSGGSTLADPIADAVAVALNLGQAESQKVIEAILDHGLFEESSRVTVKL